MSDIVVNDAQTVADAKAAQVWYARPQIILTSLAVIVLVTALLSRAPVTGRDGDQRATTYSTQPMGARLLYDLSAKMGWRVQRATAAIISPDANAVQVVFDPTTPLNPAEVHDMLQHVRHGGGLLVALGDGTSVLGDSLHLAVDSQGSYLDVTAGVGAGLPQRGSAGCPAVAIRDMVTQQGLWVGLPTLLALKSDSLVTNAERTFIASQTVRLPAAAMTSRPTVIGVTYGAGRIVVSADADVFRNDALRVCSYGFDVAVAEMLRYLRSGGAVMRTSLVFDEYHLTKPHQTGAMAATSQYLRTTPSGHAMLQLSVAGLVLLLAYSTRVLPPREDVTVDRRSPLEHVDALGRAYAQVGATRTATARLVRGVRRRLERGSAKVRGAEDDALFLQRITESKPSIAADAQLVTKALQQSVPRDEFRKVGAALARIEQAATASGSTRPSRTPPLVVTPRT